MICPCMEEIDEVQSIDQKGKRMIPVDGGGSTSSGTGGSSSGNTGSGASVESDVFVVTVVSSADRSVPPSVDKTYNEIADAMSQGKAIVTHVISSNPPFTTNSIASASMLGVTDGQYVFGIVFFVSRNATQEIGFVSTDPDGEFQCVPNPGSGGGSGTS